MSINNTCLSVLQWAMAADENYKTSPPPGDYDNIDALIRPARELVTALKELLVYTAARLHLDLNALGENQTTGCDSLLLAAAIGNIKTPNLAGALLQAIPGISLRKLSFTELLLRHGIAGPLLPFSGGVLAYYLRELSPLSAILAYPFPEQESYMTAVCEILLENSVMRQSLVLNLARPTKDRNIRKWRTTLMERWRFDPSKKRAFVLDIYEAAHIHHNTETIEQIKKAWASFNLSRPDDTVIADAMSIADWWGPLWAIRREDIDLLRKRDYLGYDYLEGLKLYRSAHRLRGNIL